MGGLRLDLQPGGLGDELAVTVLPGAIKRARPGTRVSVGRGFSYPEIWKGNPWIDPVQPDDQVVKLVHAKGWEKKTLPRKFASQVGEDIDVGMLPPEIHFQDGERKRDFGLPEGKLLVAIDTYATWETRRWLLPRFQELARHLLELGMAVVEVGHHEQAPIPSAASYRNRLNVRETALVLSRCSLFVGNDSGLFHLAAAVGTPQVIVFGVIRAHRRAYRTTTPVEAGKRCHAECRFTCVESFCDVRARCLSTIEVDAVVSAVQGALGKHVTYEHGGSV